MTFLLKTFAIASTTALMLTNPVHATTYNGNGGTGFGGPIGNGMLTFTNDGTTLTGTITPGSNNNTNTVYDELVIYLSTGVGGQNTTANFNDDGGTPNGDKLREAVSGYDVTAAGGTVQSVVNFAAGFNASYAIALSPVGVQYSGLYSIPTTGTVTQFGYLGTANLTPTASAGPYTFSILLSAIGSPSSFQFSTTYLDSHDTDTINRSNEAFNSSTDVSNPSNVGNPGQDTVSLGYSTYSVPEPTTWTFLIGSFGVLSVLQIKRQRGQRRDSAQAS